MTQATAAAGTGKPWDPVVSGLRCFLVLLTTSKGRGQAMAALLLPPLGPGCGLAILSTRLPGHRSPTSWGKLNLLIHMVCGGFWVKWILWGLERSPQATHGRAHGEWSILDLMTRRYADGATPAPSGPGAMTTATSS